MGFLSGGKKAAKIAAAATLKAANMQAQSDRDNAKAATLSMQTGLAQRKAADQAAELLSRPMAQVDVDLSPEADPVAIDQSTGRRRTARSRYLAPTTGSGIRI